MSSQIAYHRSGSGDPVVLIHGIGHRWQAFHDVVPLLARDHDVIAIDLPGFGQSPPAESYGMPVWCDRIQELFAELGIDRPVVVGNSLGGLVALELAARGTVSGVVALSPAGFAGPGGLAVAGAVLLSMKAASHAPRPLVRAVTRNDRLRRLSMTSLYAHPERLSAQDAWDDTMNLRESPGFWRAFVRGVNHRFSARPEVPVVVGWGEKDRLLLPNQGEVAARRLPDARLVPLADCGHVPMLDDPEAVVELVRSIEATVTQPSAMLGA